MPFSYFAGRPLRACCRYFSESWQSTPGRKTGAWGWSASASGTPARVGVNRGRQEGPHAHMVCADPVTGFVLVPDLGLDAVLTYDLRSTGELRELTDQRIVATPGAGPRHLRSIPTVVISSSLTSLTILLWRCGTGEAGWCHVCGIDPPECLQRRILGCPRFGCHRAAITL